VETFKVSSDPESSAYRERCVFWISESEPKIPRHIRDPEAGSLILTGHGVSIRVEKGSLFVRDGNTHFPAEQRTWRFFPGSLAVPPAIVILDGSGNVSLDAIDWLAAQRVPLIRLRWNGSFASVLTSGGQAASTSKVQWQQKTRDDPRARLAFAVGFIREKADNSLRTLEGYLPKSALRDRAARAQTLRRQPPKTYASLLGLEGSIAADYFRVWVGIPLKWKALKRHPIPEDWKSYKSRVALRYGIRLSHSRGGYNRGASHPVNAMLNYAYTVLVSRLQIRLIADGYDPMLGILHQKQYLRGVSPALALDHMEPMRPVVDRAVLQLIEQTTFSGADFSIQGDGVCRLNPELARRVTQLTMEHCESLKLPRKIARYQRKRSRRDIDAGH
jgi:CRISPR-associated protein Cas1